ncbi:MAG: hypothetical protein MHM6MM_007330 [Cercozoa sp. M6MM]
MTFSIIISGSDGDRSFDTSAVLPQQAGAVMVESVCVDTESDTEIDEIASDVSEEAIVHESDEAKALESRDEADDSLCDFDLSELDHSAIVMLRMLVLQRQRLAQLLAVNRSTCEQRPHDERRRRSLRQFHAKLALKQSTEDAVSDDESVTVDLATKRVAQSSHETKHETKHGTKQNTKLKTKNEAKQNTKHETELDTKRAPAVRVVTSPKRSGEPTFFPSPMQSTHDCSQSKLACSTIDENKEHVPSEDGLRIDTQAEMDHTLTPTQQPLSVERLSGFLWKKNPGGVRKLRTWKRRWLSLSNGCLRYSIETRGVRRVRGVIPLSQVVSVRTHGPQKRPRGCRFDVLCTSARLYEFRTATEEDCTRWVSMLKQLEHRFASSTDLVQRAQNLDDSQYVAPRRSVRTA